MGDATKIEWTHHTFNPWIGCTKVSPGCKHCYAEALTRRSPALVHGQSGAAVVGLPSIVALGRPVVLRAHGRIRDRQRVALELDDAGAPPPPGHGEHRAASATRRRCT